MYYAMYVRAGNEEKVAAYIRTMVPEGLYGRCCSPSRILRKKLRGSWREVRDRLLPGYLFLETERMGEVYQTLREVPEYIRVLGKDMEEENPEEEARIYPLSESERDWLVRLTGDTRGTGGQEDGEVGLSEVSFDENDRVVVVSGPLKELEGYIRKINLHRRIAEVGVEFMGQETVLHLGIEILGRKG